MKKSTTKTKLLFLIAMTASSVSLSSQVGINTTTPQSTLHVNGALQVTSELNVGGNATTTGSAGASGQILTSKGAGAAPAWSTLEDSGVVSLSSLALKNSTYQPNTTVYASTYAANTWNTVVWNTAPKLDNAKLSYSNTTGVFTVLKAGYYQVLASTHLNMSLNPADNTSGTAQTVIQKNTIGIAYTNTGHGERTNDVFHTIAGAAYFNAGDNIRLQMSMTRRCRIAGGDSFISITYLGQ